MTRMRVVVARAALSENDIVARESAASRRQVQRPRLGRQGYGTGGREVTRWLPVTRRPDRQMRRPGLKTGPSGRTSGLAETRASGEGSLGNFPRTGGG